MATTTIVDGNVYITTGSVSGNTITHDTNKCVTVHATKIDQGYDNQLNSIPTPQSKGNRPNTKSARVIDLKRFNEAITINGFLEDEAGEAALVKRNNLLSMAKNNGELTLVFNKTPYQTLWTPGNPTVIDRGVFIRKMDFSFTAGLLGDTVTTDPDGGSNAQPETSISVQLNVVRGKDM